MKRIGKTVSALLCAALLGWYVSPPVYRLLNGPHTTDAVGTAPALTVTDNGAVFVRRSADQTLSDKVMETRTVRLFGVVPLRTVELIADRTDLYAGGDAIGIVLHTEGVQIVGLGAVQTGHGTANPAANAGLKPGDAIVSIDGKSIKSSAQFAEACKTDEPIELLCKRDGNLFSARLLPVKDQDGTPRIGAWVRDSTSGIGTLSFVGPDGKTFAALGHGVSDIDTGVLLSNGGGFVFSARITGVQNGGGGRAGELLGSFETDESAAIGKITQNTAFGIAGRLTAQMPRGAAYPLAEPGEVYCGDAEIVSTVSSGETRAYRVHVIRTQVQASPQTQGMMIEVVDDALLDATGGIVQGMSGSPVLQDGKLIGVVTHVFLNDSTRGYCIYAKWMYERLLQFVDARSGTW